MTPEAQTNYPSLIKSVLRALNSSGYLAFSTSTVDDGTVSGLQLQVEDEHGIVKRYGGVYSPARMVAYLAGVMDGQKLAPSTGAVEDVAG